MQWTKPSSSTGSRPHSGSQRRTLPCVHSIVFCQRNFGRPVSIACIHQIQSDVLPQTNLRDRSTQCFVKTFLFLDQCLCLSVGLWKDIGSFVGEIQSRNIIFICLQRLLEFLKRKKKTTIKHKLVQTTPKQNKRGLMEV